MNREDLTLNDAEIDHVSGGGDASTEPTPPVKPKKPTPPVAHTNEGGGTNTGVEG